MTVALQSPGLVSALIPVDNAPVRSPLRSDVDKYVRGMQEIESAKVTKSSDADKILQKYEKVSVQKRGKSRGEKKGEKQRGMKLGTKVETREMRGKNTENPNS
jgi:hypothetical protein